MDTFITKWHISDYDGRRNYDHCSKELLFGKKVYACKRLSSWFRYGEYLIKHDIVNVLFDLNFSNKGFDVNFNYNVKDYYWDKEHTKPINLDCTDEIVEQYSKKFTDEQDMILQLYLMQREMEGYEFIYFIADVYHIKFNMVEFLRDKDAYLKKFKDFQKEMLAKNK